jgi:GTP cyclohydrolase I
MPDVANDARPVVAGALDWVGMGEIAIPVTMPPSSGQATALPARVTAYVNLHRADARGIHMSRLYRHIDRTLGAEPLSPHALRHLLREFLDSHADLSDRALVRVRFDLPLRRPALASDASGWKLYPVALTALLERNEFRLEAAFEVLYSSTCPSSAALARQLIQQRFAARFGAGQPPDRDAVLQWLGSEEGICATPHAQRSAAEIRVRLLPSFSDLPLAELIDLAEGALRTPVQAAVKREDEQAFARLNGENLMFCEDAARRLRHALAAEAHVADFWIRATHFESLHPHDAVAIATRGMPGGYGAGIDASSPLRD